MFKDYSENSQGMNRDSIRLKYRKELRAVELNVVLKGIEWVPLAIIFITIV